MLENIHIITIKDKDNDIQFNIIADEEEHTIVFRKEFYEYFVLLLSELKILILEHNVKTIDKIAVTLQLSKSDYNKLGLYFKMIDAEITL